MYERWRYQHWWVHERWLEADQQGRRPHIERAHEHPQAELAQASSSRVEVLDRYKPEEHRGPC